MRDNLVYKATLPDIDTYPYESIEVSQYQYSIKKLPPVEAYTAKRFCFELENGTIHLPFLYQPKKSDDEITNDVKKKKKKKPIETDRRVTNDIQAELERKFDELFGALEDEEDN